eukprot:scaffold245200_cov70-Attheya_sp.AAC.1
MFCLERRFDSLFRNVMTTLKVLTPTIEGEKHKTILIDVISIIAHHEIDRTIANLIIVLLEIIAQLILLQ